MRRHRIAAALSQEALAELAGISTRAISDLERSVKTRPHLETVRLLTDALTLSASEQAALIAAARPGTNAHAPITPDRGAAGRMPPASTPLIGRAGDVARVVDMLAAGQSRLVTLIGPGGVGKTSLARAIAGELGNDAPDGIIWVDLAPVADPRLVSSAVAHALELPEQAGVPLATSLKNALCGQRRVLVLDNCEQVRAAAAELVSDLLDACPELSILATSRARLQLSHEQLIPVEPLLLPPTTSASIEEIGQSPSVALFVQRARAARSDFVLDDSNAQDIATICRKLDGLPLAIELAAARIRILSPAALRALLDERLRLLTGGAVDTPPRHQTLEATLAWSYELLEPRSQATFRALAACAGGCTFETVAAITEAEDAIAVLDDIETMVDQSLLRAGDGPDGNLRYSMLETVRDYARARLADDPEADAIRDRHAAYFVGMAEQGDAELYGPEQERWLRRLDADRDNMREALPWLLARGKHADLLRLASALWSYWHRRGQLRESSEWLERAVALSDTASPESRAVAMVYLANAAINLDDHARAARHYQASKDLWTVLGHRPGIASCLVGLGLIATSEGDFERAHELYAEALDVGQEVLGSQQTLAVLSGLGQLEVARGDLLAAAIHLDRARLICEELGDKTSAAYLDLERIQVERLMNNPTQAWQLANHCLSYFRGIGESRATGFALVELGYLDTAGGNVRRAAGHLREAQAIFDRIDDHLGLVRCMEGLVHLAVQVGRWHDAAVLSGGAGTWRASTGTMSQTPEQASLDEQLSITRLNLGPNVFVAAVEEGSQMPFDQVARVARGLLDFIEGELTPHAMVSLPAR